MRKKGMFALAVRLMDPPSNMICVSALGAKDLIRSHKGDSGRSVDAMVFLHLGSALSTTAVHTVIHSRALIDTCQSRRAHAGG